MIPTSQEILNQLLRAIQLHPEWTASELAHHLGYPPLFVINAMDEAESRKLITRDIEADTLKIVGKVDVDEYRLYGEEILRISDEIFRKIAHANIYEGDDVHDELLLRWASGIRALMVEIALNRLYDHKLIVSYKMADPLDKLSVYTFLTLPENKDKKLALKQFKIKHEADKKAKKKAKKS